MAGEELLIADGTERDREGLRKLFDDQGYVCTACGDLDTAKELVRRKFFPVAVIDLDFGTTSGGLELGRFIGETSRPTRIVLLTGRRSFEAAVDALRLGAVDVVAKRPDQIEYLQASVRRAIDLARTGDKGGALLHEVKDVMAESLRILLAMGRKLYGGADATSSGAGLAMKPAILLVDEDQGFREQAARGLGEKGWDVSVELSGGSGLDRASSFSFQIVAVREQLSDLPGQMVLRSAQAQQPQVLGLLYSTGPDGKAERYESGKPTRAWPCTSLDDLVGCVQELVDELVARREERRYMQSFRNEHGAFLKRFAELKVRIDQLTD
jgi:DNA-binding NtrC family response regulator